MPVTPVSLDTVFTAIGHFVNKFDATQTWRSTMDIEQDTGVPAPTDAIFTALAAFWQRNMLDHGELVEIELRQWSKGNQPFLSQGALWRKPLSLFGNKSDSLSYGHQGTEIVGGEVCALVERIPNDTGRIGHMFIRALLDGDDLVAFAGGHWQYGSTPHVTPSLFQGVIDNAGLRTFIDPTHQPHLCMVHWKDAPTPITGIAALTNLILSPKVGMNKISRKSSR